MLEAAFGSLVAGAFRKEATHLCATRGCRTVQEELIVASLKVLYFAVCCEVEDLGVGLLEVELVDGHHLERRYYYAELGEQEAVDENVRHTLVGLGVPLFFRNFEHELELQL